MKLWQNTKDSQINCINRLEATPSCGAVVSKTVFSRFIDFLDVAHASSISYLSQNFILVSFTLFIESLVQKLKSVLKSILHCWVQLLPPHLFGRSVAMRRQKLVLTPLLWWCYWVKLNLLISFSVWLKAVSFLDSCRVRVSQIMFRILFLLIFVRHAKSSRTPKLPQLTFPTWPAILWCLIGR